MNRSGKKILWRLSVRESCSGDKFVGIDFCHVYRVFGIEHEFDGRDYWSHVNFSADGADYGNRSGSWNQ